MIEQLLALLGLDSGWDGSERRRGFRAKCDFELEVATPALRYLATALDLGPQGMRLRIRGPYKPRLLKKGTQVRLRYLTPLFGAEEDSVMGSVRWLKKEAPNIFLMAVTFTDTLEHLKKSWLKVVLQKKMTAKVMTSRRKYLRVRCSIQAQIHTENRQMEGRVINVSATGAQVESLRPIPEHTHFTLEFEKMQVKATVRRCDRDLGIYKLGVLFLEDRDTRRKVLALVKQVVALQKKRSL